jgi:hypothetical protein
MTTSGDICSTCVLQSCDSVRFPETLGSAEAMHTRLQLVGLLGQWIETQ